MLLKFHEELETLNEVNLTVVFYFSQQIFTFDSDWLETYSFSRLHYTE